MAIRNAGGQTARRAVFCGTFSIKNALQFMSFFLRRQQEKRAALPQFKQRFYDHSFRIEKQCFITCFQNSTKPNIPCDKKHQKIRKKSNTFGWTSLSYSAIIPAEPCGDFNAQEVRTRFLLTI